MLSMRTCLVVLTILGACTCGVRTECDDRARISVLVSVHDDPLCKKLSPKGVLLSEAAKLIADMHNNKSSGFDLDVTTVDTCGSITGALKASMKALVRTDIGCLQPPHFLGFVGPESLTNAEAVHKITSVLKVPQLIPKQSNSAYLHYMQKESDTYVVESVMKVIEILKWKTFTLAVNGDNDNEDDVQNIAKKITMKAIAKNLCVIVRDEDDDEEFTSHIIHIGKPKSGFFSGLKNSTVLIVSEGRVAESVGSSSLNNIMILESNRNEFPDLEKRFEHSSWWKDGNVGKFDMEELRDVRWLQNAIETYATALDALCKKKKCKNQANPVDWNHAVTNAVSGRGAESKGTIRILSWIIQLKNKPAQPAGAIIVEKEKARVDWSRGNRYGGDSDDNDDDDNDDDDDDNDDDDDGDDMPDVVKKLISKEKKSTHSGCTTTIKEVKLLHEDIDDESGRVLVSQMDDSEWWTMVCTVGGVGVAMFLVGILAVYVVYANIRGPTGPKTRPERDTSLRRVGSDREISTSQRQTRVAARQNSNRSIASNFSDKSV